MDPTPDSLEMINLKLLLVSGKSSTIEFTASTKVYEICQYIYSNWPDDWEERPDDNILRLIYHGRFLDYETKLKDLNLPPGLVVMHLIFRKSVPQPGTQDEIKKSKSPSHSCFRSCCCIC